MKLFHKTIIMCVLAFAAVSHAGAGGNSDSRRNSDAGTAAPPQANQSVTAPPVTAQPAVNSTESLSLDEAIAGAASYFIQRIPGGDKRVALVSFDTPSNRLSNYILAEVWTLLEDSNRFVMVDRRNLDRIETEIMYQYGTGRVDDNLMVSVSRQAGAQFLVYGQMTPLGRGDNAGEYRLTVYAIDVESAVSNQRAYNVRYDNRLASLLGVSAEEEIDNAVALMARSVNTRTTIAVGRISYGDTQTVSSFSAWLKNSVITAASKYQDKLQIATETQSSDFAVASRGMTVETPVEGSAVQAVVTGSYIPMDSGAEVSLQLTSVSGNKTVLSSSRFYVSASELERRRLSLLPESNNTSAETEFEQKQRILDSVLGGANRWNFTVTPDSLDGIYYDGDYMTMRIYSQRDCYFRVIHVDVNGDTQLIYPASPFDNSFIRAGETRRIPDNSSYRMHAPFGEEIIIVSAYDQPFTQSQSTGQMTEDSLNRVITAESGSRTQMTPSATARFNYLILPRQ
ncbi:MAG: DUF4384 domain-containing protein [Treponema sp.]|nr:DUF4384 domain-containing protein [Treponema sp.]